MPLPKSLTSLITAIVVAIPAAITTLALNKPKPPKEIDEVITLEENTEVIPEEELTPTLPPPPPPEPKPPSQDSGSSGSNQQGLDGDGTVEQNGGTSEQQPESKPEAPQPQDAEEPEDEVEEQEEEENAEEKEDKQDDPSEQPEQQGDKDMTKEELQQSLIEVIKKIIEEGSNFDSKDSRLYKLYIVKTSLDSLPKLITSLKDQMEKEKSKAATEASGVPGSSSESDKQSK